MKTIVAVCGMGLGSSLVVEMNIKTILHEMKIDSLYSVTHENLNGYQPNKFDYVICGQDLANNIDSGTGIKIILNNIMDLNELRLKLKILRM